MGWGWGGGVGMDSNTQKILLFYRYSGRSLRKKAINFTLACSYSEVQSTFVIPTSMRLPEMLRDIRTSTYQICRIKEKINRTTTFHK